jgi:hypothetical protein
MSFKKTAYSNVYQRVRKNGQSIYYAKFTVEGKPFQRSLSATTEKSAYKEYLSLRKNIKGNDTVDEVMTLGDFFRDIYIPLVRPIQALQTIRTKEGYFKSHVQPVA